MSRRGSGIAYLEVVQESVKFGMILYEVRDRPSLAQPTPQSRYLRARTFTSQCFNRRACQRRIKLRAINESKVLTGRWQACSIWGGDRGRFVGTGVPHQQERHCDRDA